MIDGLIRNIIDVPGVAGACLFNGAGQILPESLPSFYIKEIFDDQVRRIIGLFDTIEDNYLPTDELTLKYDGMTVQLYRGKGTYLMVFVLPEANVMTVKMVSRVAIKNVTVDSIALYMSQKNAQNAKPKPPTRPPIALPSKNTSNSAPVRRRDDDDDDENRRRRHSYRGTQY
ncbi:MAG: hypothetical protein AAGA45_01450 [Verrucomicrobiota bacterium]